MIIKYRNDMGELEFNTKGEGDIRIIEADGLYLPQPTHYTVNYFGCDGQKTLASYIKNRTITISGDIKIALLKKFADILSFSGELVVNNKKIKVCVPSVSLGKRYGNIIRYVLQMKCDNPYFTDEECEKSIYYRTDEISDEFTLPTVFTQGVSKLMLNNESNYKAYPEIIIRCITGGTYGGGITVENSSVGCVILLKCALLDGETVAVNVGERKVISSKRGNMLKYIADDSYIGDFVLKRGNNILTVSNENTGEEIYCDINPCIKYAECDMFE